MDFNYFSIYTPDRLGRKTQKDGDQGFTIYLSGLPADLDFGKGNPHDPHFVSDHLKRTAGKPKVVLSLDKGYTSLELRRELGKGVRVNMQMRTGDYIRKREPNSGLTRKSIR